MSLSRQELFQKLLEQIHFPEKDNPAFRDAKVQSVVVHKDSRLWEFHLMLRQPLPFNLFSEFSNALTMGFRDIANTRVKISSPMTDLDPKLIGDYWEYVVRQTAPDSPMTQQVCTQTSPEVRDGRVTLVIENEMMKDFLTKNVLGKIEEDYVDLGFPKFRIHPFVDESASEARIKELKAKHEADDAALAAKAMEQIKKNNILVTIDYFPQT